MDDLDAFASAETEQRDAAEARVRGLEAEQDAMRKAIVDIIVAGEPSPCGGLSIALSRRDYERLREAATPPAPAREPPNSDNHA